MARKATMPTDLPTELPDAVAELIPAKQRELAAKDAEIIDTFGDGLPYIREHYVAEIRRDMRRTVESCIAIGRRLIVMKAMEPHGQWMECLNDIGVEESQARRLMESAKRIDAISNRATSHDFIPAIGSQGKLFELLSLPDAEFQELAETGAVGSLALDDVSKMTVRELREALRKAKEDLNAKDAVAETKERQIERLHKDVAKAKRTWAQATPDEQLEELRHDTQKQALSIRSALGATGDEVSSLRNRISALMAHAINMDSDQTVFLTGLLAEVERELLALREDFGIPDSIIADEAAAARRDMGLDA